MASDSTVSAVEDALALCGLFEGYPTQRRDLAGSLILRGIPAAEVAILEDWSHRAFSKAKRLAGLANVLEDEARCREVLEDLRRLAALQAEVAERGHRRFEDRAPSSPESEEWAEVDRAVAIATRIDVDLANRWRSIDGAGVAYLTEDEKVQAAADEFGIDFGLAAHLLAKGRVLLAERRRPLGKAARDGKPETPDQRLDRFRAWMKDHRRAQ